MTEGRWLQSQLARLPDIASTVALSICNVPLVELRKEATRDLAPIFTKSVIDNHALAESAAPIRVGCFETRTLRADTCSRPGVFPYRFNRRLFPGLVYRSFSEQIAHVRDETAVLEDGQHFCREGGKMI